MRSELLIQADQIVAALSPGKRESVREIMVDAVKRGTLVESSRRFLELATGSSFVADVLAAGIAEQQGGTAPSALPVSE